MQVLLYTLSYQTSFLATLCCHSFLPRFLTMLSYHGLLPLTACECNVLLAATQSLCPFLHTTVYHTSSADPFLLSTPAADHQREAPQPPSPSPQSGGIVCGGTVCSGTLCGSTLCGGMAIPDRTHSGAASPPSLLPSPQKHHTFKHMQ